MNLFKILKYFTDSVNVLITPIIISILTRELTTLNQYGNDLLEIANMSYKDSTILIGEKFKSNTFIIILAISLILIIIIQTLIVVYYGLQSRTFNTGLSLFIIIIILIFQLLIPILIIYYYYSPPQQVGKTIFKPKTNIWTSLWENMWTNLFIIYIIANVAYLTIYKLIFYISIEKVFL